jgi:hypothetical protein
MKRYDTVDKFRLAKTLANMGLQQNRIRELTGAPQLFIKENYIKPQYEFRNGNDWLRNKGGEKKAADRILRYLLGCHPDNLGILKLEADNLVDLYEGFMVHHMNETMSINRFYFFALGVISGEFPVMKCECCKKPFVTEDATIKECSICYDIKARKSHMEGVKRRRAEKQAMHGIA